MRGFKNYILTALLFVFSTGKVVAQETPEKKNIATITGKVTDKSNKAIPGVTVEVQEENRRTITGADGSFAIEAAAGDILIFSKSGFATSQKTAGSSVAINIALEPTKIGGGEDDDVTIPFGSRKKRELNYAVSKLDAGQLAQIPTSNVLNLLGGRIPGLYVQQTNSTIGSESATLQIRGRSTYNTGNSPRILVDGIPRDASALDINEIESVTVLKDAAALTWYGLNAANGVVLINTKKGSSKKMSLNFTTQTGINQRTNGITPLNSYDYSTLYNEALTNIGQPAIYNQAALDAYRNHSSPFLYPNNNYLDSFLKTSAAVQRYVLSIDGGSNNFRYFTMLSYLRQDGFFQPSQTADFNSNAKYQRINFRVNLDYDVTKTLSVSLYAGARTGSVREPLDGGFALLSDLYNLPPNAFPITNPDGSYGGTSVYQNNPLARLQGRGYQRTLSRSLLVNLNAKQKINFIKGLSANVLFSYDAQGDYISGLSKNYEVYDMTGTTPYATFNPWLAKVYAAMPPPAPEPRITTS